MGAARPTEIAAAGPLRRALRWAEHGFALVGVLFVIYSLGFEVCVVTSGSMSPTLEGTNGENGDWVLIERISYWFRNPRRWEVVALALESGTPALKRVVGLPGERVSLEGGQLRANGKTQPRPPSLRALTYLAFGSLFRGKEADCGPGYFVMGDDSKDSQDSRFEGPADPDRIRGRAWLIVWPPERIRRLDP